MAMALLLIVLVFVSGLFLHLFVSSTKSLDSSVALDIADSILTQANDSDPSTWPALAQAQQLYNHDPRTTTQFDSQLSYRDTSLDSIMGKAYEITVEVYWMGSNPSQNPNRRSYGRQSVRLSKIVYVSDMKDGVP